MHNAMESSRDISRLRCMYETDVSGTISVIIIIIIIIIIMELIVQYYVCLNIEFLVTKETYMKYYKINGQQKPFVNCN